MIRLSEVKGEEGCGSSMCKGPGVESTELLGKQEEGIVGEL